MSLPVAVLAGGRGARFGGGEKPLAEVGGRPMVLRVLEAVVGAGGADVCVATSRWTPRTAKICLSLGYAVRESPGKGYVEDVQWLVASAGRLVTVASDLPFLAADTLRRFLTEVEGRRGSVTGLLPEDLMEGNLSPLARWPHRIPGGASAGIVGINVVDPEDAGEGGFHLFTDPRVGVNVNTPEDLLWANRVAGGEPVPLPKVSAPPSSGSRAALPGASSPR